MSEGALGVAVVGAGYWGGNYVRMFQQLERTTLVAVCDASTACLQSMKKRFPHGTFSTFTSLQEMLKEPKVQAVVVSVPAKLHYEVVKACLEAKKHVLCEKPLTTDSAQALDLARLASSHGVLLMVGHTFLFNVGITKLLQLSEKPDFGKLYYVYAKRTNLGPIRSDVNASWDLATHDVSIFLYFMESKHKKPLWVSASGQKVLGTNNEDVVHATIGFEDNITANIHCSWIEPLKEREIVVVGSNQKIVFDDVAVLNRVTVHNKGGEIRFSESEGDYGSFKLHVTDGDTIAPALPLSEPLKVQCEHFVQGVLDKKPIKSDAEFGYRVVQVLEAIDRSMALGGSRVSVGEK